MAVKAGAATVQTSDTTIAPDYDVAIIGYGPVGAALANLLGMSGLKVAVLEREALGLSSAACSFAGRRGHASVSDDGTR